MFLHCVPGVEGLHVPVEQLEIVGAGLVGLHLMWGTFVSQHLPYACLLGHLESVPGEDLHQDQDDVDMVGDVQLGQLGHSHHDILACLSAKIFFQRLFAGFHHRPNLQTSLGCRFQISLTQPPS